MRRLFWMGVGAAVTVVAAQRVHAVWRRYTPQGVADQVEQAGQGMISAAHSAWDTFTTSFASRERDLTSQLLVTPQEGDPKAVFGRSARTRENSESPNYLDDDPNADF
jgi:hypothetical protein